MIRQAKLSKQARRSRGEGRQKTRSLFGDSTIGDAEVLVFHVCKRSDRAEPNRVAVVDIKRAYFYAPVRRPIFIKIPKEDLKFGDEGCVGQLQWSLYGTRDAAQNWERKYTTFLLSFGFWVERASPCNFTHQARRVHVTVQGDDFTVVASAKQIAWLGEAMNKRYELKVEVPGPNTGQTDEVRVLNRIISCARTVSTRPVQENVSATRAMMGHGAEMDDKRNSSISCFGSKAELSCRR